VPNTVIGEHALAQLTRNPRKRSVYRYDPYMREGLNRLAAAGLAEDGPLHEHTFVVLKPDAVAGRRCRLVLDTLAASGWHPVAATVVRFDPLLTRELWRYQFNAASEQRIAVVDHLLGSGASILILLVDLDRPAWLPASTRLAAAKGSAEPSAAREVDLRTRIGRVNGLFNFIHSADEPADVVRELQLFSYQAGWSWCLDALLAEKAGTEDRRRTASKRLARLLDQLEAETPAHDLDVTASLRRLARIDGPWGDCARHWPAPAHVDSWLKVLSTHGMPQGTARWDVLTTVTSWINCNEPEVSPLITTAPPQAWHDEVMSL
jgi:nucleoside diphosphate kinase